MNTSTYCPSTTSLAVIVGGGLGAYFRYLVQSGIQWKPEVTFPWGTLIVNLTGAFLIGLLMTAFAEHFKVSPAWRMFLVVGILGGFTTFSSLTWETYALFADGYRAHAAYYVLASAIGGALSLLAGIGIGHLI